ncbi:MAG: hypothetical protein JO065_04335 [Acidobacteria bacterium]|nr:hypothetical protein [Acidobacteriota bacterium]
MDSRELDKLNFDLGKFFDFDHHPHVYSIFIWKGDFTYRERRSAATYVDIAVRCEAAIEWIRKVSAIDRQSHHCFDCGRLCSDVARIFKFNVVTTDEEVYRISYDDWGWSRMIRVLQTSANWLRSQPEAPMPCKQCGGRRD